MNVVASKFVWGTAMLKTALRDEICTGTVMFMHVLAIAGLASTAAMARSVTCIMTVYCGWKDG